MAGRFLRYWSLKKASIKLERLYKIYTPNESVLDVGSGNGGLCLLLQNKDIAIASLDIVNKSCFSEIKPILYSGDVFPFKSNYFDTVQIITVLHHIKDPEQILVEAIRTGNRIVIMEDIYTTLFQKYITFAADSINNWEFIGHPHSNKTDAEWRALFKKHDLIIESVEYYQFLLFFTQVTYVLSKKK